MVKKRAQNELTMTQRRQWRVAEDESKNIRENEAPENPSPMQENKQINEMKKFINHWWRRKRVDRNKLTMTREHNEARKKDHQSRNREKTWTTKRKEIMKA